ncbi:MAG: hypothetical protein JWQ16_2359 [Novosphingobium sp.]|nr:hypothetical protein [Novosphingobium sp.]
MGASLVAALALAAASPGASEASSPFADTPEAAIAAIFAPYSGPTTATASWDYPIYSQQTAALIARWRAVASKDEPDALSDGDWLCLCQDFNHQAFKATILLKRAARGGTAVSVNLDLGGHERRSAQLVLKREAGTWKLDDIYAATDFPNGLKQKLQETILEAAIP